MSRKRILIAAGGTGGHLFPAQALARELLSKEPSLELLFAGAGLSRNPFFDRERLAFVDVPAARPRLSCPWQALQGVLRLCRGARASWPLVKQAHLVVGFGSYHTLPVLFAATRLRCPLVLHAGDAIPGRVVRWFSKSARLTALQLPGASSYIRGRWVAVETPMGAEYTSKSAARKALDLRQDQQTLLVVGGSQGARALNETFTQMAPRLAGWQLLHMAGTEEAKEDLERAYRRAGVQSVVKVFEVRMDLAWQAADLAIMRAGAASMAEQMRFAVPAILIPFPLAADNHQEANARFIEQLGGGLVVSQESLTPTLLCDYLSQMEEDRLEEMRSALRRYRECNQRTFSDVILDLIT